MTPSHEHDDDLEPTVNEDEVEVERYDVEDDTAPEPDALNSWDPARTDPPRRPADEEQDAADDRL